MKYLLFSACALMASAVSAQSFQTGYQYMAKGKPSQVTLATGEVLDGNLKDIDWKRGVYEAIVFTDSEGKDHDLKAADIKQIYGFPGGLDKFSKRYEFAQNIKKATDKDYDFERLGKGMILFEQTDVIMKKKQFSVLMQLLNPDFCSKIKVYRDPIVKETPKYGIGGITFAGGDIMTYYVRKGTEPAFRIEKKHYKESFKKLFGDNDSMMQKYGNNPVWYDLAKHVAEYSGINQQ